MRRPHVSRAELGETKLLNFVWLSIALTGVYFGVMYIPPYSEQWNVKSLLQDVGNSNWRNYDEEKVRAAIAARIKEEYGKDGKGLFVLEPENIFIDNNDVTKKLTVRITWTRIIPYPFIKGKQVQKTFTQQYMVDTNPVKY
ncbi:MAG TPA: hypothetical protein VGK67_11925 [Myxococcales bacterium]|jgi:hypothetical protein